VSDSHSTSEEFPPLGELLRKHLEKCSVCQSRIQTTPNGLGMVSRLCFEYQDIIADWADREGQANNIVNHDEYGNEGSPTFYERGGNASSFS
jgi:hypothetical protein